LDINIRVYHDNILSKKYYNMKFYTWCHLADYPKLDLLQKSAQKHNIKVTVLGKDVEWKSNYQKIALLLREIRDLDEHEIILCTDAFDVLYLATEKEIVEKFHRISGDSGKIIFGAQIPFGSHYPQFKKYWDKFSAPYSYRYLNSGTFIGYAADLVKMLTNILDMTYGSSETSDQKLYAMYGAKFPGSISLDYTAELFWCPEQTRVLDLFTHVDDRLKCRKTGTYPCFIHISDPVKHYHLLLDVATLLELITIDENSERLEEHNEELALRKKSKSKSCPNKKPQAKNRGGLFRGKPKICAGSINTMKDGMNYYL